MAKKKRIFRFLGAAATLIVFLAAYITLTTAAPDPNLFRAQAWNYTKHDKSIVNWKKGEVEVVRLDSRYRYKPGAMLPAGPLPTTNLALLWFNGNRAVHVTFHTTNDPMLGPVSIYFNPFTFTVIGVDARE